MNKETMMQQTVGAIVTDNFATAKVMKAYGLDFCCHGETPFKQACEEKGINIDELVEKLQEAVQADAAQGFNLWPTDLLIDYVVKIHHRNIRNKSGNLLEILDKVTQVHGDNHPELHQLQALVHESIEDLLMHLDKEENVLFPFIMEMLENEEAGRKMPPMHCGSVQNPIRVMRMEHENEGNRYMFIIELTNHFTAPDDACNTYRLLMKELEAFVDALFEHIHIENNILFPRAVELENRLVEAY